MVTSKEMYLAKGTDSDTCVYDCRVSCLCLFLFQDSYGDDPVNEEEDGINIELLNRNRTNTKYHRIKQ